MPQVPIAEGIFTMPPEEPRLIGGKCDDCGLISFPQQSSCARCGSTAIEASHLGTKGKIWAWTTQSFPPPSPPYTGAQGADFVPYAVGFIELPGEVKVEARITENDPAKLRNGLDVELVLIPFRTDEDGNEVLTFAFAPTGGN
jgi:uncharacterized OB-fold protein